MYTTITVDEPHVLRQGDCVVEARWVAGYAFGSVIGNVFENPELIEQ